MLHRVRASIDLKALRHNLQVAIGRASPGKVLAVIKANAYGHGLVPVAGALDDADMFGVTDVDEAEALRQSGCDKPILVLQGLVERHDIPRIAEGGFHLVIHRREELGWLEAVFDSAPPDNPLCLWLKLQSGMGRLGLAPIDFARLYKALAAKPWVDELIMMTHLANSSLPGSALNEEQLDCFSQVQESLDPDCPSSVLASAGLLSLDFANDWTRTGIMLYGSSPFAWTDTERRRGTFDLNAVMTLQARLINIRDHRGGDNIGYNSQFICPCDMRIGIVSIGYADGYPGHMPNGCPVSIRGRRSGTVGRVSMDMLAIDLSDIPEAELNDVVTLWGDEVSIDEVAHHAGMISYNLMTNISSRVPRHYV